MSYKNIKGLRSKTINILTVASTPKFKLQNNNELGLPSNAVIVAIQCRAPEAEAKTANGNNLINQTVFQRSYLNLKVREKTGRIDLLTQNYYMPYLVNNALFLDPRHSSCIDWNESYIQIKESALASVDTSESYEIIVYYLVDCPPMQIDNRFCFRTGNAYIGERTARFEFLMNIDQTIYKLANTENIGLPQDAIVLGFTTSQPPFPLKTGTAVTTALKNSFITIKKGTTSFIDAFPCQLSNFKDTLFPTINYLPIEPHPVKEWDWNQSFIEIKDKASIIDGERFSLEIVWYKP